MLQYSFGSPSNQTMSMASISFNDASGMVDSDQSADSSDDSTTEVRILHSQRLPKNKGPATKAQNSTLRIEEVDEEAEEAHL